MEEFINAIISIKDTQSIFILCGIFISFDILTGYLKAIKKKEVNSSISRDGFIKKLGWITAIIFGYLIKYMVGVDMFLYISSIVCIATEGISIYENLGEIGVNLKFKKYFEKLKDKGDEEDG